MLVFCMVITSDVELLLFLFLALCMLEFSVPVTVFKNPLDIYGMIKTCIINATEGRACGSRGFMNSGIIYRVSGCIMSS